MYIPSAPLILGIDLTRKCNISCRHCIVEASEKENNMPFELAISLVNQASQLGVQWLDLNGGEPFLYPKFFTFIKYALNKGLKVIFITNGTLVNEKIDKIRKYYSDFGPSFQIGISIDGHCAELHGYFRPKETFTASIEAVKALISVGIKPTVFSVLHRGNLKRIPEFLTFLSSLGVSKVRLLPFIPLGKGRALREEMLSKDELWWVVRKKPEWNAGFKGQLLLEARYEFLLSPGEQKTISPCMAGYIQLGVSTNGDFYSCAYMMDYPIGNINENSIAGVWQNSPVLKALRDPGLLKGTCSTCVYRDGCHGGCRGLAYLLKEDYLCSDPYCPIVAQKEKLQG